MKKYKIYLFQNYLRKHILNFGLFLKECEFNYTPDNPTPPPSKAQKIKDLDKHFKIKKTNWIVRIRRIVGLPNIRLRFARKDDAIFTYGCFLITNKPYCIYVENSIALFNYDLKIAKNPIAQMIFKWAIRMKNCKKIIFMSKTAEKSFYSTLKLSDSDKEVIKKKSTQCYPLIKNPLSNIKPKTVEKMGEKIIKFLFAGTFYIKGGLEIVNAFIKLRKKHKNILLTIISDNVIKPGDWKKINETPEINKIKASFSEKEMFEKLYNTHDVFLMPTFRDSFCLVLVEALSAGMPIIANDQFATKEMVIDGYNGFVFPNHPLKDYNPETYEFYGKLSEPADFYDELFEIQKQGKTGPVEEFLYNSMEKFILNPNLIEEFSKNSLELYNEKFHYRLISDKIESVFLEATKK